LLINDTIGSDMKPQTKTNAIRIIESMGIRYDVMTYDPGEEHVDAATVAQQIGVSPDIVFKTLVTHDEKNNIHVFCLPGNGELNLKKAAKSASVKRIELIALKDLFELTGYVRGGCSPVGMKKKYPVFIDETAMLYDEIYVNAGSRGLQMILAPADLCRACDGRFADIAL
jgi:Cys-tRNA(Pro)/Cys-tRNA(Cys) deacylase